MGMENIALKKKANRYSKWERKNFLFVYVMVALPVLHFLVFWLYVNASSLMLTFQSADGSFTFNNFRLVYDAFIKADVYGINLKDSLFRSMFVWLLSNAICFPAGIVTTYVLFKQIRGHYVFRVCFTVHTLFGAVAAAAVIRSMLEPEGVIINLLLNLGIELPGNALRQGLLACEETAFPTLCVMQVLFGLVGNNVVLTGAYSRIPDELFDAASLDGAGFWRTAFSVAIPCVSSTLCTLMTFQLCSIFTADNGVYLYSNGTGMPEMSTIGFQLYNISYKLSTSTNRYGAYGYPACLGFCLTVVTLPIVLVGRRVLERLFEPAEV